MNAEKNAKLNGGTYLNSRRSEKGDDLPDPKTDERASEGGLLGEAKAILARIRTLLADSPSPQLERTRVFNHATGGPGRRGEMLTAMGQAYDAAAKGHGTEVTSLNESIQGGVGPGLLQRVEDEIRQLNVLAANTPKELEVKRQVVRYTWLSIGLTFASLVLLGLGINTTGTILMGSGIPGLDQPLRAYLFSFVPAGLALGAAGFYRLLSSSQQLNYARAIWSVGLVFGTLWVLLFSRCFAGFAQDTTTVLNNILASGNGGTVSALASPALIACGILAEVFLAAGCSIAAQRSFVVTEAAAVEPNPEYPRLVARRDELTRIRGELNNAAGQLKARLERLSENRKDFLNKATEFFDIAVNESGGSRPQLV